MNSWGLYFSDKRRPALEQTGTMKSRRGFLRQEHIAMWLGVVELTKNPPSTQDIFLLLIMIISLLDPSYSGLIFNRFSCALTFTHFISFHSVIISFHNLFCRSTVGNFQILKCLSMFFLPTSSIKYQAGQTHQKMAFFLCRYWISCSDVYPQERALLFIFPFRAARSN